MIGRIILAAVSVTVASATASSAHAQAAAEGAVILSGTSAGTGRASSGLGNAVRGSINGATIRVSGRLRNSASARCKLNCPGDEPAAPEEAQLEAVGPEEELPTKEPGKADETARPEAEAAEPD